MVCMRRPFERFRSSLTSDNLWIYILLLLKKKDMYPYEIQKEVKENFDFMPGNMTAYIVLKRLSAERYIKTAKVVKEKGPAKTYYSITEKGEKELQKARKFHKKLGKMLDR